MKWSTHSAKMPDSVDAVIATLLKNRGISTDKEKTLFFEPPHPESLTERDHGINKDFLKAVRQRLELAKTNNEDVLIFGDYDADGICATAILWEALHEFGLTVRPFIPDRAKHGYGMNHRALSDILSERPPKLIFTVDNGIVAHDAVSQARKEGIDVIISDHHQPEKKLPDTPWIIHSTQLCGATVAWVIANYLNADQAKLSLDLAAIATIADQVPLSGANRSFAVHGLSALRQTTRIGITELCRVAQLRSEDIDERSVGFALAPRINAMGRLASGLDALRLLCTKSAVRAKGLSGLLQTTNTSRQEMTGDMYDEAKRQARSQSDEKVIVVHSPRFHEGIIGLIAGRLAEEFEKPAIVLAVSELTAKGSARSLPGCNITELMRSVREDVLEVGGHPLAGGCLVDTKNITVFTKNIQRNANLKEFSVSQQRLAECVLPAELISSALVERIDELRPFGSHNEKPTFLLQHLKVADRRVIGKQKDHLKYELLDPTTNRRFTALHWGGARKPGLSNNNKELDQIAVTLEISHYDGSVQMVVE